LRGNPPLSFEINISLLPLLKKNTPDCRCVELDIQSDESLAGEQLSAKINFAGNTREFPAETRRLLKR
jgi:hypothetical protein